MKKQLKEENEAIYKYCKELQKIEKAIFNKISDAKTNDKLMNAAGNARNIFIDVYFEHKKLIKECP
jgi:hypothetical protein